MTHCIHFCSTPRNLFLSLGQAVAQPDQQHHLIIIDQPANTAPIFKSVQSSPGAFASVYLFQKGKGFAGKRKARIDAFKRLDDILNQLKPSKVYVGNDRRVEFQYFMQRAKKAGVSCDAFYLEDGVNSYLDAKVIRKKMRPFADVAIEPLVKKLSYGTWYDRGKYVGCSKWVSNRLLTFPTLLADTSGSPITKLDPETYKSQEFTQQIKQLVKDSTPDIKNYVGDLLLLLPHSQDLLADYGDAQAFIAKLEPLLDKVETVFVKYHPNEKNFVLEGIATPLPHKLPMEMLLSVSDFKYYVGDTSAALLNVKWLNPNSDVYSVDNGKEASKPLFALMSKVGIEVASSYQSVAI